MVRAAQNRHLFNRHASIPSPVTPRPAQTAPPPPPPPPWSPPLKLCSRCEFRSKKILIRFSSTYSSSSSHPPRRYLGRRRRSRCQPPPPPPPPRPNLISNATLSAVIVVLVFPRRLHSRRYFFRSLPSKVSSRANSSLPFRQGTPDLFLPSSVLLLLLRAFFSSEFLPDFCLMFFFWVTPIFDPAKGQIILGMLG